MTQNKPFAGRRDEAAAKRQVTDPEFCGVNKMALDEFLAGYTEGYRSALEDMWPLMNEANVALITLEADGSKWNSLRNALDLFERLKKESEGR